MPLKGVRPRAWDTGEREPVTGGGVRAPGHSGDTKEGLLVEGVNLTAGPVGRGAAAAGFGLAGFWRGALSLNGTAEAHKTCGAISPAAK